ncbi:substrate-binding domain-containing protein [Rhodoferax ferrireducens]|uniref:ABC transporter substrate-binding protein n=1 Tax=Rhodoferax ferrireducens TaxID=192843 RepID=UPI000E0DD0AA|nr:substrate-binding domain-containing protein [Rhodoferax ferrireducens]
MKKIFFVLIAWLLLLPVLAHAADKVLNIVFIPKSSDQVFWDLMRNGVEKAVTEDGNIKLTWRGPVHNADTDSQIRILQVYTQPGVDAILIAPTDRARLLEPVRKAVALGIKVIVVDSALDGNYHTNQVATDNINGGKLAAKRMADLLGKRGRVMMLRTLAGSASTDDRAQGFITYLKEYAPHITLVDDVYGGGSTGKLRRSAAAMLKKHPAVDGVFAVNESSTDGMLRALREQGLAGKIKFVGFDSTDLLIQGLESGEIHGLVVQNPYQMGYQGIKAAVAAIHQAPIKDRTIFTEAIVVTRENVKQPAIQKLICSRC